MRAEDFEDSPTGRVVPIKVPDSRRGVVLEHVAYVPNPLPDGVNLSLRTHKMISEAERAVGRLDSSAARLPRPELLIRPTLYKEAVSTSALEGTYAPLFDVLEADYIDVGRQSSEVREVRNYADAAREGMRLIVEEPIRFNLIKRLQSILVRGTRGDGYDAGSLRSTFVFIGDPHSGLHGARFVPPPPGPELVRGIDDWDKWINRDDDIPLLARIALAHYQFETLHPFTDGNGRIGRLIMVLQLMDRGALQYPVLNLSPYLEPNKETYKDLLLEVSKTGDLDSWIQFFARGVREQAERACQRITKIVEFRTEMLEALRHERAKGIVLEIVDDLIGWPVITPTRAASLHSVTYPPANSAIQRLVGLGFLEEVTGRSYGRVFACRQVMNIVDEP